MLQIVFREGPIDRAAENFMQFFLQGQQLEQRERLNEIRKEELKLRQEAFEQEATQRQAQLTEFLQTQQAINAFNPGQLNQIANAGAPTPSAGIQRAASAGARATIEDPTDSPALRRQAGQFLDFSPAQTEAIIQETAAVEGLDDAVGAAERALRQSLPGEENAGIRDQLLGVTRFSLLMTARGAEASSFRPILDEITERLPPSQREALENARLESQTALNEFRAQEISQAIEEEDQNKPALIATITDDPQIQAMLSNMSFDDVSSVGRERANFLTQPEENAFNFAKTLLGRVDPVTGGPAMSIEQVLNRVRQSAENFAGVDVDFTPEEVARLEVFEAVGIIVGFGITEDQDVRDVAAEIVSSIRDDEQISGVLDEQAIRDEIVDAMVQRTQGISEGRIKSAVNRAFQGES